MGLRSTVQAGPDRSGARTAWARWEPLTGIAFVVLFVASFVTYNSPNSDASDKEWLTWYADRVHQALTVVSAFLMVIAALCLVSFLTTLWNRIATMRRPDAISPLPLVAAGVSAACIAIGGVMFAATGGAMIFAHLREPGVDVLRLSDNIAFPLIAVAGMYAASLSIAGLSIQARVAGLFGKPLMVFGLVVAVALLAAFMFFPMLTVLLWAIVVSVALMRGRRASVGLRSTGTPLAEPA